MDAYSIGALFGRLFASYLVVLLVLFLFNRFNGRKALAMSVKWYSLLATAFVLALGVFASIAQTGSI